MTVCKPNVDIDPDLEEGRTELMHRRLDDKSATAQNIDGILQPELEAINGADPSIGMDVNL